MLFCSCASLLKMAYTGSLSVEQCIKTVLFFTETRSVAVTKRRLRAHFQTRWVPSFKTIHNFITSLIMMVQCWRGNVASLHLCILQRTLTLSLWRCKEAPVNEQGRLQHNYVYPDDQCKKYWKVIWICIPIKWQCCLNLQFKTNIKEWHLLNGSE
jgi:hypothetical protein